MNFWIQDMSLYLEHGKLPEDKYESWKVATQSVHFTMIDNILCLYYVDSKCSDHKLVVPQQLQQQILQEGHCGLTGGHFLEREHWWW